jgi:uncharacterized lipoprotein YddW (UPF0748 family)
MRLPVVLIFVAAGSAISSVSADLVADQTPFHSFKGLWVSRYEYSQNNTSIDAIFANAQSLGITDVMFQVRGQADAYYDSAYEHRTNTSYDSLARAVQQAHSKGIRLHAWMNAMPLWNGSTLPTDQPGNPYLINQHPEFWIRDSSNNPQPLNSGYVIVNPTMPEVKQHIWNVVDDLTTKYAVDGVHLDYIRLYNDTSGSTMTYPTDAATVARFQALPGNAGKTPTANSSEYKAWCASEITALVSGIRQTMKDNRPTAQLTAAVWRDANIGVNSYQQDWKTWVDRGLLDAAMPMIYRKGFGDGSIAGTSADSGNLYRSNVTSAVNWRGNAGIMPGLGPYMQDDSLTAYGNFYQQLLYAKDQGSNGVQLFSYGSMFATGAVGTELRRAWNDFYAANGGAPNPTTITNFEADEGFFPTNITFSGSNANVASTSTADRDTTTAAAGIASQKLTINKTGSGTFLARHVSGIGTPAMPGSNQTFASNGSLGFWLKTSVEDVEVAVAVDDYSDNTSTERGYFQNIIPDGQWHFYQWMLNDVSHWDGWAGANNDGTVESLFTLDSIQFRGSAASNVIFLDDVTYSPAGVAGNQWSLDSAINTSSPNINFSNAANWVGGVPNGVDAIANFLRRATAAQSVTVDAPVTLGSLRFDNLSSYTLSGATITFDVGAGSGDLRVTNRGAHTIAAPIQLNDAVQISVDHAATLSLSATLNNSAGRSITKNGNGTLIIGGAQLHGTGAAFSAVDGVTEFNTSSTEGNLALSVASGARVNLNANQHLASMTAAAGGTIDLKNSAAAVNYTGATSYGSLVSLVQSGSVVSTSAPVGTMIAIGEASDLFASFPANFLGMNVDATTVLMRNTVPADANLDGSVNSVDFGVALAGYGTSSNARWTQGDFNGDGKVNTIDFNILSGNFGSSLPTGATLGVVVPEPASLAGWVLLSQLLRRRSRVD